MFLGLLAAWSAGAFQRGHPLRTRRQVSCQPSREWDDIGIHGLGHTIQAVGSDTGPPNNLLKQTDPPPGWCHGPCSAEAAGKGRATSPPPGRPLIGGVRRPSRCQENNPNHLTIPLQAVTRPIGSQLVEPEG